VTDHVQLQHMIVDLIRVLVETAEGVNLVVSAVGDRGVDQTSRPLTQCSGDLWSISISTESATFDRGIRHEECVVRGDSGRRSEDSRELIVSIGRAGAASEDGVGAARWS